MIQLDSYEDDDNAAERYEMYDMTVENLEELDRHLDMSVVKLSSEFIDLHKALKKLLSSLDVPRAS
jgi:hypothetical protein